MILSFSTIYSLTQFCILKYQKTARNFFVVSLTQIFFKVQRYKQFLHCYIITRMQRKLISETNISGRINISRRKTCTLKIIPRETAVTYKRPLPLLRKITLQDIIAQDLMKRNCGKREYFCFNARNCETRYDVRNDFIIHKTVRQNKITERVFL